MSNAQFGVIVDRSSFDESDQLGFGNAIPSLIAEDPSGAMMKNGKVKRKLRWKPPTFQKKKSQVSSNFSVVSALSNKSASTNRSISTMRSSKSFHSRSSAKSQNSFHTFHSSETKIVTNTAKSPPFSNAVMRPSHSEFLDAQQSTIGNEGNLQRQSESFERNSTMAQASAPQLDISPISELSSYGESGASVLSDPFDEVISSHKPEKRAKSKRPPLFKRKQRKPKNRSPRPSHTIQPSFSKESVVVDHNSPAMVPIERDDGPLLELENDEEDTRVALWLGTTSRECSPLQITEIPAPNAEMISHRQSLGSPAAPSQARTKPNPPPSTKRCDRPIDNTTTSADDDASDKEQMSQALRRSQSNKSVPVDLDSGSFYEAENNLRAIHEMASEHLAYGEYVEAIEVFEEILRGQRERYGKNHYRVGTALHNLGIVHLKSGDAKKAIEFCGQAVDVRKEALVPNHPDVAASLAQLGVAYLESHSFEDALVAFREALHIRRAFLGPRHPKCAKVLNNIGCAQYSLDDLESSMLSFEEALDIQRDVLRMIPSSEEAQDTTSAQSNTVLLSISSTLCNIGSIRLRWGQFDEAGVALDEALLVCYLLFCLAIKSRNN